MIQQLTEGLLLLLIYQTKQLKLIIYNNMNVRNQKKFFKDVYLDNEGNMVIFSSVTSGAIEKGNDQYKTFKKLKLTAEGYLKTTEI